MKSCRTGDVDGRERRLAKLLALTLLEMMVAVTLLAVIMIGLLAMFNQTQKALRIANGTDYGLTGGIYSRSPAALDRARREFLVGNLYLNRPITGALVGRQPFGGFKMSGIGSKAGGRDYLLQFVLPRTVTEHTVRRGFAPPVDAGE